MTRVLVAGMGNVLRTDDGFGVEVARRLVARASSPPEAKVIEVGIGGIHLVQELMVGYDALIVIDATEQGSAAGTVHVLEAEVADLATWPATERSDFLADMHYTTPSKALVLARALAVLPPRVYIVGCQPFDAGEMGIGLSEPVRQAVAHATHEVEHLIARLVGSPARAASTPHDGERIAGHTPDMGD